MAATFAIAASTVTPTLSKEEVRAQQRRLAGPWLHAWHDPVANVKAFSACVRLADVHADGEYKLLVADSDKKLKVYKGTSIVSEHALLDVPSALATFYTDLHKPQTPSVAVAAGPYIFIYRNLRPYFKFTLPPVDIEVLEQGVWSELRAGRIDCKAAVATLSEGRDTGVHLSSRSMNLLSAKDEKEQEMFCEMNKHLPLVQLTVVTCMETMNKSLPNDRAVSMLVVGTEAKQVLIMDPAGTNILTKIQLPSIPVFMSVNEQYDVAYRIVVACRNGNVYQIKKGKVQGTVIELETQPCGLIVIDKNILVGCMDNVIHSFHFKGKKNYSIYLPDSISCMSLLHVKNLKNVRALIVALANGDVRLYNKKHLVSTIKTGDVVTAMRFGPYGREEASLVLAYKSGALTIKMLQRMADLEVSATPPGPPPEQDIPLNVPKKTKLYVEQTQRERDQAIDMHRIFQRDLCKLRLATARSFVKVITDGQGPLSTSGTNSLRLDAKVQGLGPLFKLKLNVKNTGVKSVCDIPLTFAYNHDLYRIKPALSYIPVLIPGLEYQHDIDVECIDPSLGLSDVIRVFICNSRSTVPAISAIVTMPTSEVDKE